MLSNRLKHLRKQASKNDPESLIGCCSYIDCVILFDVCVNWWYLVAEKRSCMYKPPATKDLTHICVLLVADGSDRDNC
jgi:hypothetical protein